MLLGSWWLEVVKVDFKPICGAKICFDARQR